MYRVVGRFISMGWLCTLLTGCSEEGNDAVVEPCRNVCDVLVCDWPAQKQPTDMPLRTQAQCEVLLKPEMKP